jgi:Lipocalin-like domain
LIIKNQNMKKQSSALKNGFFLVALAFATLPAFSQSKLVGSWRLTAADKILPDGKEVADYGTDPRGIAIFTADGHYVIEIFRSEHLKFASGDRTKGTPEEYKDAVLSASCHFGTYTVDAAKGTITFHTERASYPNWDETTRVASFTLEGDKLTWHSAPRPDGIIPVSAFIRMP